MVDALFDEWDDRVREANRMRRDEQEKKDSERRIKLEERAKQRYQQVYLWCRYEGWFSDGPHPSLSFVEGGQAIVDENGDPVVWWDSVDSCWRARKHPDWRIEDPPRISASRRSKWR